MGAAIFALMQTPAGGIAAAAMAVGVLTLLAWALFGREPLVADFADTEAALAGASDDADLQARVDVLLRDHASPQLQRLVAAAAAIEAAEHGEVVELPPAIVVLPAPDRAGDVQLQGREVDTSRPGPAPAFIGQGRATLLRLPVVDLDGGDEIPLMQPRERFTGNAGAAAIAS